MVKSSLELKGSSFTLSVLHIQSNNLDDIDNELSAKLAQAPQFFLGAPLVVNLSEVDDNNFNLCALKDLLMHKNLVVVGITGAKSGQKKRAKELGLAQLISGKQTKTPPPNQGLQKLLSKIYDLDNKFMQKTGI